MRRVNDMLRSGTVKNSSMCKGRVYRGRDSIFLSSSWSIIRKTELYLLKRESCPGCDTCDWIDESLGYNLNEDVCLELPQIVNGAKYKLSFKVRGGSYYDPYDVDVEFKFVRLKEMNK